MIEEDIACVCVCIHTRVCEHVCEKMFITYAMFIMYVLVCIHIKLEHQIFPEIITKQASTFSFFQELEEPYQ